MIRLGAMREKGAGARLPLTRGESVVNDAKVSKNNRKTTLSKGKFFLAFTKRPAPYVMDMRRDQHFLIPLKKLTNDFSKRHFYALRKRKQWF